MPQLSTTIKDANTTLISKGNLEAIGDFFTQDYVAHLTDRDVTGGHSAIRRVLSMQKRAFPDLQLQVDVLVETENRVAWQRTIRGTHLDYYHGFPATGREVVWRDMVTSEFRDGLIAEEWLISDLAERLLLMRKD